MDWHKLQHTLFEIDPSDPREDLAKLQQAAQGGGADVPPTKDYVAESVEVPEGSMPLGLDSIADFAALAGVRIDEKQKIGSAGQAKGKDPMPSTSKPSDTGEQPHPLKDKLVGEEDSTFDFIKKQAKRGFTQYNQPSAVGTGLDDKNKKTKQRPSQTKKTQTVLPPKLETQLSPYADQFQRIFANKRATKQFDDFINKIAPPKTQESQEIPKPRDPSSKAMQDIRKSGAAGAHKDKKKVLPRKEKHKNKQYETIKDRLWAALNEKLS